MDYSTELVDPGRAWPLDRFDEASLSKLFRVGTKGAVESLAHCRKHHEDPTWIAEAIDALPAPTLVVLGLLVEARGLLRQASLEVLAKERFQLTAEQVRLALGPAIAKLLVVPLDGHSGRAVALVWPAAAVFAPLVVDLDVAPLPAAELVPASGGSDGRAFLAACGALRHVDVKATNDLRPHRAAVKRLAKQLGIDDDTLSSMIVTAIAFGMVREDPERNLRPVVDALAALATKDHRQQPLLAAIADQARGGPVSLARIGRWVRRATWALLPADPEHIGHLPGFCGGTVGGHAAIAAAPIAGACSGHVTPSFEVFLPPESPGSDIVRVLTCCELVRIDRMIVAKVSKASISRAVGAGLDGTGILAVLTGASRTPVPQNVEVAIRDWVASSITATVMTGKVIVVDPSATERVQSALAALSARILAPGVILVDAELSQRELAQALARSSVQCRTDEPEATVHDRRAGAPAGGARPKAVPTVAPQLGPTARTLSRVAAWRRGEPFEGKTDDFLATHVLATEPFAAAGDVGFASEAHDQDELIAEDDLIDWEDHHRCPLSEDDFAHIAMLLAVLGPDRRALILGRARTLGQLLDAIGAAVERVGVRAVLDQVAQRRGTSPIEVGEQFARGPLGASIANHVARATVSARASRSASARDGALANLTWHRDMLLERLQLAARSTALLVLDVGGRRERVQITQVLKRGSTWMILGDNLETDTSIALPLSAITAVSAVPDPAQLRAASRTPWQPRSGEPAPAGHLPCPCGSSERYRRCCRPPAT